MTIPGSLLKFEMIQSARPGSFVQKFIDARRPGMHHICCEVASVEAACEGLRANGVEPFGGIVDEGWKKHTFLHPKDSGGVLFQLFEEPSPAK
jgi:methylmalonyl-CoA/ethylmalonyl-CoA epimerase